MKSYTYDNLSKDSYTQPLNISEILDELEIFMDDYWDKPCQYQKMKI